MLDPTFSVTFLSEGSKNEKYGALKLQQNNGNILLSFFPNQIVNLGKDETQNKISQIPDYVYLLYDFTSMNINPNNKISISLYGVHERCQYIFEKESDRTQFIDYICKKAYLKHSNCNPDVFLLESFENENEKTDSFLMPILPKPKNLASERISPNNIEKHGLEIAYNEEVKIITSEDFNRLFDEEGRIKEDIDFPNNMFNVDVDITVLDKLWKLLLNNKEYLKMTYQERLQKDKEEKNVYKIIKKQWKTTTFEQWKNYPEMRSLVRTIENDIKNYSYLFENFDNSKSVQKIAFNVFLTLSFYNWDGASYINGMVIYLIPFLKSIIKKVDGDKVTKQNGEIISTEDVEAEIFYIFNMFYNANELSYLIRPSKQPFLKRMFPEVGETLEKYFPELLKLLYQKYAFCLDFLKEDCEKWFTNCFDDNKLIRFWISAFTYSNPIQFFKCFITSLLFTLSPSFAVMNPLSNEEFQLLYHEFKLKVDLNTVLINTNRVNLLK